MPQAQPELKKVSIQEIICPHCPLENTADDSLPTVAGEACPRRNQRRPQNQWYSPWLRRTYNQCAVQSHVLLANPRTRDLARRHRDT